MDEISTVSYLLSDFLENKGIGIDSTRVYVFPAGTLPVFLNHGITDSNFHTFNFFRRTEAEYDVYIDGTLIGVSGSNKSTTLEIDAICARASGSYYCGKLQSVHLSGKFDLYLSQNWGTKAYSESGKPAQITGATLANFWQKDTGSDVYPRNFINGFKLFENGTAGEEIRTPISVDTAQFIVDNPGYTLSKTVPAQVFGNWEGWFTIPVDCCLGVAGTKIDYDTMIALFTGDPAVGGTVDVDNCGRTFFDVMPSGEIKNFRVREFAIWNDDKIWDDTNIWRD